MSAPRNASAPKSRPTLVRTAASPAAASPAAVSPNMDAVSTDAASAPRYRARPRIRPTTLEWVILLGALGWVVLVLLLRWPALLHAQFNSNSNMDSAFFAFAAQAVRDGGMPYLAFSDHKPPLIYFINALAPTVSGGAVWNLRWRYPETGVAWWTMTPAMRAVYDYVRANYVVTRTIGPYRWVVYQRVGVGSPLQR